MSHLGRVFEFRGYLQTPTGRSDLLLWIEAPRPVPGQPDFYCEIDGSIFGRPLRIYGEDREQAQELAYSVMEKKLAGKKLLDLAGAPIDSPIRRGS